MTKNKTHFILTDIEGTTSSISFVIETLFPYFRKNIDKLKDLKEKDEVLAAFEQTKVIVSENGDIELMNDEQIIDQLLKWSIEDKKITPLKTLQGILWEEGYISGELKGHVYSDVKPNLLKWKNQGIQLGVFSSGSVAAQKLIFKYSEDGDLSPFFSFYFDTKTGGKRETETYVKISKEIQIAPENILFLSDILEELEAAEKAGYKTIQLVREGSKASWHDSVADFDAIKL